MGSHFSRHSVKFVIRQPFKDDVIVRTTDFTEALIYHEKDPGINHSLTFDEVVSLEIPHDGKVEVVIKHESDEHGVHHGPFSAKEFVTWAESGLFATDSNNSSFSLDHSAYSITTDNLKTTVLIKSINLFAGKLKVLIPK